MTLSLYVAPILSLMLLCFITYGEVLGYYFTSIDAFPLLLAGKIDSLNDIFKIFSSPLGGGFPFGTYYRPISELSYGIDYLIWGKNPMGYHLINILLHLANSIMVFTVAYLIFKGHKKGLLYAWVSSVLFLLSPLSVAVVPSIAQRQEMLAALLLGLSLLSFAKMVGAGRNGRGWFTTSLLFGCLAIFSKENAFVLPVLIWLLSFIFDERGDYRERSLRAIKYSLPFVGFVLLNIILHIYLFGFFGVIISSNFYHHVEAAANSFFSLTGFLNLLQLNPIYEVMVFLVISLIVFLSIIILTHRFGIRGLMDRLLSRERGVYTYLIFFILAYMILFTITGKAEERYFYPSNMVFTILMVRVLVDTFRIRALSILVKLLAVGFVLYTIVYSPLFTQYSAWRNSSEITRKTIEETEKALNSEKGVSRIYLINWPAFIGLHSNLPGRRATILVNYSMLAWAKWIGHRDIEFITISHTLFPPGDIRAKFGYTFLDGEIAVDVEGCLILPPKFPYRKEVPVEFRIDSNEKKGELIFLRGLDANERVFLYDTKEIRILDSNHKISVSVMGDSEFVKS